MHAENFFDALDAGTPFTVTLTYDSGAQEILKVRTRRGIGFHHADTFFHGTGAPARRCLASLVQNSAPPLKIAEREHPW